MAKPQARIAVIQFCFALGIAAVVAKAARLQLVEGATWAREAQQNRTSHEIQAARRGALYDRNGVALATTQELYHVGIAPDQVTDSAATIRLVSRQLGIPIGTLQQEFHTRKYLYFHGPFSATQLNEVRKLSGIHPDGIFQRTYPSRDLALPIVGRLDPDRGSGLSGIERALDSVLTGQPGEAVYLKDRAGRKYESPARVVRTPVSGADVWLTIDASLQEIAERGLEDAVKTLGAEGGDVVFLEPMTGEILALAARQTRSADAGSASPSFFTDPYQPGSTAKLFTAAALLERHRVDSTSAVSGEGGHWEMPVSGGRTRSIDDAHAESIPLTLARAIEVSSNIAMAKFSQRLSQTEQFETLRDFGFGSPTGVEFPAESRGVLQMPDRWRADYSRASHAMGYEFSVTPIQLASAYAAIANGGVLLTPSLVRQIRDVSGRLLYEHQPEPVRRVISAEVAATLRGYLRGAVSKGGTGAQAQVANFALLGKTGTTRRVVNGTYTAGGYTASFAAIFPADRPQLVVIVKIDNPSVGSYYAGSTAAPATRSMIEQALAARRVAIDRSRFAAVDSSPPPPTAAVADAPPPVVLPWPPVAGESVPAIPVPVPDVAGVSVRQAVLTLHRRGFRVALHGLGNIVRSAPAAGERVPPGTTISVWTAE